jgi:hypothetical protein
MTMFFGVKRYLLTDLKLPLVPSDFKEVGDHLKAACKMLKQNGKGNLPCKMDSLTLDEVAQLFEQKVAGSHSPLAIRNAVVIMCLVLGRRARSELKSTCLGDLKIECVNGQMFLTVDKERISKMRQGENPRSVKNGVGVLAEFPDNPNFCPVKTFLKYIEVRPESMRGPDSPMFLTVHRMASKDPRKDYSQELWFYPASCGINTLGSAVYNMVKTIHLDVKGRRILNTFIRKMVVSSLIQNGIAAKQIMAYTGHRSVSSLVNCDNLNHQSGVEIT